MADDLAPVIFLDPIGANCGCVLRCEGHQPTPSIRDRRTGYREAADVLERVAEGSPDREQALTLVELLRASADLCIPAAHPTRPDPRETTARLLRAVDDIANHFLPEGDDDQDGEDQDDVEAGSA